MYCSSCGKQADESINFCPSCGSSIRATQVSPESRSVPTPSPYQATQPVRESFGLNLASLIVGGIAVIIALFDYALLGSGDYTYIEDAEVGLLFILSCTALGLAIGGAAKKQRLQGASMTVSIVAMLLTLSLTTYMLA